MSQKFREQGKRISECLQCIKKGVEEGAPTGENAQQSRKNALARLKDFVSGDSSLLLHVGREYPVLQTLANALLRDDAATQHAVLYLLEEFIPVVKKKYCMVLCSDEHLCHFLSLVDSAPPDMAEKVCVVITQLVTLDDATKDKFWSLCSKKPAEGSKEVTRPNVLSSVLRRNLDAISQLVEERRRQMQALPFSPVSPPAFQHQHTLTARASLVKSLCSLLVECLANSVKRKDLFGNKYGLITVFVAFMRSVFRIGPQFKTTQLLLGDDQDTLIPLAERLAVAVGVLSKDNTHLHSLLANNTQNFTDDVIELINAIVPWCVEHMTVPSQPPPTCAFAGSIPSSRDRTPPPSSRQRPGTPPLRPQTPIIQKPARVDSALRTLRAHCKQLLFGMLFMTANMCYNSAEADAALSGRISESARQFISPKIHKAYRALVSSLLTLKKKHYDVDAVVQALQKIDKAFRTTTVLSFLPPCAASLPTSNSNSAKASPVKPSKTKAGLVEAESADDESGDEEDEYEDDLEEVPTSDLSAVSQNLLSQVSRTGSNVPLRVIVKYFFINTYNGFGLLIGALNNIDEDIIYFAGVTTYKLLHRNSSAQRLFIRQSGLDIVNQLLRDYDLDIQLTGLFILKLILTNEPAPTWFLSEPVDADEDMDVDLHADDILKMKVKIYDIIKETGVPTYLLNIVTEFSALFGQIKKGHTSEKLREDDEKEMQIVSCSLGLLNTIAQLTPSMQDCMRELNAVQAITAFLRYCRERLTEFFNTCLVRNLVLTEMLMGLISTACVTLSSIMKDHSANQDQARTLGTVNLATGLLSNLLPYSMPTTTSTTTGTGTGTGTCTAFTMPPVSPATPSSSSSSSTATATFSHPMINDARSSSSSFVPPPAYCKLVNEPFLGRLIKFLVAAVSTNSETQAHLRNDSTRSALHSLLSHPVQLICNHGLLLLSHLVWCSPESQSYFFTPLVAEAVYAMLARAHTFFRRVSAAPSPLHFPFPARQDDEDVLVVDSSEQVSGHVRKDSFLEVYSQYYQQAMYGLITLTNLSNQNNEVQSSVGRQWITVSVSTACAPSTSTSSHNSSNIAAPSLSTPAPIGTFLCYFAQVSDVELKLTALTCINNMILRHDDNAAKFVRMGVVDILLSLIPTPTPSSLDDGSECSGGGTSFTSTTCSSHRTLESDDEASPVGAGRRRGSVSVSVSSSRFAEEGEEDDEGELAVKRDGEGEDSAEGRISNKVFMIFLTLERYACNYLLFLLQEGLLPQLNHLPFSPALPPLPPISALPTSSSFSSTAAAAAAIPAGHCLHGEPPYEQLMKLIPILNGLAYMNQSNRGYLVHHGAIPLLLQLLVSVVDPSCPSVSGPNHIVRLAVLYLLVNVLVKGETDTPSTSKITSPMLPLLRQRNQSLLQRVVGEYKLVDVFIFVLKEMSDRGFKRAAKHQKLVIYEILQLVFAEDVNTKTFLTSHFDLLEYVLRDTSSVSFRLCKESSAVLLSLLRGEETRLQLVQRPEVVEALQRLQCMPHVMRDTTHAALISQTLGQGRH
eukprot:NODE_4_length_4711_cov_142.193265_g3_i0.p1 GENE.NODE_4_length_4711_cov_142.193265_g3_i0~~NODE_4_length_4711_cov_142.193265_g3_i0.p1  ORF type:complete len:1530 (+),score=401.86 NODE_4_length_4711_cov_142.193265_g3_i0:75-4664(+)